MENQKDLVSILLLMEFMKVNSKKVYMMEKELLNGVMDENMKENSNKENMMEKVNSIGQMERNTKENIRMVLNMVMDH